MGSGDHLDDVEKSFLHLLGVEHRPSSPYQGSKKQVKVYKNELPFHVFVNQDDVRTP
jgi:hypothetical protein